MKPENEPAIVVCNESVPIPGNLTAFESSLPSRGSGVAVLERPTGHADPVWPRLVAATRVLS